MPPGPVQPDSDDDAAMIATQAHECLPARPIALRHWPQASPAAQLVHYAASGPGLKESGRRGCTPARGPRAGRHGNLSPSQSACDSVDAPAKGSPWRCQSRLRAGRRSKRTQGGRGRWTGSNGNKHLRAPCPPSQQTGAEPDRLRLEFGTHSEPVGGRAVLRPGEGAAEGGRDDERPRAEAGPGLREASPHAASPMGGHPMITAP